MPFPARKALWVVLVAVLLHAGMLGIYVSRYGSITALVGASYKAVGKPPLEDVTVGIGPGGYDGMFYYSIARDPWIPHTRGMDQPAYRHLRVLYPLVCWLLSGGNAQLLFWVMPLVNLLAIAGMTALGAWLAWRNGLSLWWGLVVPLAVSATIPAARDLTDNLSTLAIFALLAAWLLDGPWWLLTLLALAAVFTREQNILVVGIVLLVAGWTRRTAVAGGMAFALAAWLGWLTLIQWTYGESALATKVPLFGEPLAGFSYAWTHLGGYHDSTRLAIINGLSLLHIALCLALAAYVIWQRRSGALVLVLLAAMTMALFATDNLFNDLVSYRRALVWLPVALWLAAVQAQQRWLLGSQVPGVLFSLAVTLHYA